MLVFFLSHEINDGDHLIISKFPDCSVYSWLQIWPWHPLLSLILGLTLKKRWISPMWRPIDQSLMFLMINWWKPLNTWADLLVVNYIQNYDVATENTRTFDGLNFNLSVGSSSSVDAFFFFLHATLHSKIVNAQINDIYSVGWSKIMASIFFSLLF